VTLSDHKRHNGAILRYLAEFGSFLYLEVRVGCRRKKITFAIWWVSRILLWLHAVARSCDGGPSSYTYSDYLKHDYISV